jgi:CBS domain-containing protein
MVDAVTGSDAAKALVARSDIVVGFRRILLRRVRVDEGDLPVVEAHRDMLGVIEAMRDHNKPAVLVRREDGLVLLTQADVLTMWNTVIEDEGNPGKLTAADLAVGRDTVSSLMGDSQAGLAVGRAQTTYGSAVEGAADSSYTSAGSARLAADEAISPQVFGAYTECVCAGPAPRVHKFAPSMLGKDPTRCTYSHGARVTCS